MTFDRIWYLQSTANTWALIAFIRQLTYAWCVKAERRPGRKIVMKRVRIVVATGMVAGIVGMTGMAASSATVVPPGNGPNSGNPVILFHGAPEAGSGPGTMYHG
jgi:hypothetical protein